MTIQIPLVVINGTLQQLPLTDTISAGISGPFTWLYSGSGVISFSTGSNEATLVLTGMTNILSTSTCRIEINPVETIASGITHTINDHLYAASLIGLSVSDIVVGVGFTINARSIHKLSGGFSVSYTVI